MSAFPIRKLKQAEERLHNGDVAGAQFLCEEVLRRAPRNPDALRLLGLTRLFGGRAREAVPLLQQSLSVAPRHGLTLENLGLAHLMLNEFAEAERVLRTAAALPGAPASVFMRLGAALLHQGKPVEAMNELQRAMALAPDDVDTHLNLGQAYARLGDDAAARRHLNAVLKLSPDHADAMFNLGVICLNRNELTDAGNWFERIIARFPRYADAYVNLGIVLQNQDRFDEAVSCFRRALDLNPALAAAGNNLARTLALQRKLEEAHDQYFATLQYAPHLFEAHEGLAAVCFQLGRFKESIVHYREVLRLDPQDSRAWAALADALFQHGEVADAESAARQASLLDPNAAAPYSTLALVHIVRGEIDRAIEVLECGFQGTNASGLLGMLAHQLRRACDWQKWREVWREVAHRLEHSAELGSPFWLLHEATTAEEQLSYTRRWAEKHYATVTQQVHAPRATGGAAARRLRIGYLSSDLQQHAAAYLLAGVLERHDRSRFEIFAYSYGPEDHSPMRARLREACEHFIEVTWDPDDVIYRRILDDAPDILVDLKGYTLGARTSILARRPCPIQVNWLGYPGTMGAPFIDYLIADSFIVPPEKESAYSERVLRLKHCWQCNDRTRPIIEPLAHAQYGLPEEGFVFCCFTQAVKVTPEIFARWMNLLRNVPQSVLWLAADNRLSTKNLKAAAQAQDIAPDRLVIAPKAPFAEYLARYRVADLALDTFPYTSHSTASDALWIGCPLVALCGDTFASRVSGSILTHAGLPELITYSLDDYEKLALQLATDRRSLESIRSRVAATRSSALFDADSFARDLEGLYIDMLGQAAS